MPERIPAEVFPPGELLREELQARGWTPVSLACSTGLPLQIIDEIITGHRPVTPKIAKELEKAIGISAGIWLNLEYYYRLFGKRRANTRKA